MTIYGDAMPDPLKLTTVDIENRLGQNLGRLYTDIRCEEASL